MEHSENAHDVARDLVSHGPGKPAYWRLPVDDRSVIIDIDRRAGVRPSADPLYRRLEGRQEPVRERSVLLLVLSLGIDQFRRCKRVVLDFGTHPESRLAATISSTSLQLKVLTLPEVICWERPTIVSSQARSTSVGSSSDTSSSRLASSSTARTARSLVGRDRTSVRSAADFAFASSPYP